VPQPFVLVPVWNFQEAECPILVVFATGVPDDRRCCGRGVGEWDTMKVDRPGLCLLLADSSNSVILFRELEYVVIGALCLAKDKVKSGVAHILESHPREQRARMGTLVWECAA